MILLFDQDKIERFAKSYDRSVNIKIENVSSVSSVGCVGSEGCVCTAIEVYRIEKYEIQLFDNSPNTILRSICDIPNDHRIMTIANGSGNSRFGLTVTSLNCLGNENLTRAKPVDNSSSIYRIGRTDNFACPDCRKTGDKWYMQQHICNRNKK